MNREEEIQKIGKKIQFQINKLKKLNCSIDMSYHDIGIFDNTIKPIMHEESTREVSSHDNQIVFSFDISNTSKFRNVKYWELIKKSSSETLERINIEVLNKKELKQLSELDVTNESYFTRIIDYEIGEFSEIFDHTYNTLRSHLNKNFPSKFINKYN